MRSYLHLFQSKWKKSIRKKHKLQIYNRWLRNQALELLIFTPKNIN